MIDQTLEITPSSSPNTQPQTLGFSEVRSIHEKSLDIAQKTFPETNLKHKRRSLAREITLHNAVTKLKHKDQIKRTHDEGLMDPLTRIKNLEGFRETVAEEMARMQREEFGIKKRAKEEEREVDPNDLPKTSLLFIDADDFKTINDSLGHNEGDKVLQAIAKALEESTFRETDTPARVGGDEFALLLPGSNTAGAVELVKRLIPLLNGIRVSIGIASLNPSSFLTSKEQADRAMYVAKAASKEKPINQRQSEYRVYDEATMQNIVVKK